MIAVTESFLITVVIWNINGSTISPGMFTTQVKIPSRDNSPALTCKRFTRLDVHFQWRNPTSTLAMFCHHFKRYCHLLQCKMYGIVKRSLLPRRNNASQHLIMHHQRYMLIKDTTPYHTYPSPPFTHRQNSSSRIWLAENDDIIPHYGE